MPALLIDTASPLPPIEISVDYSTTLSASGGTSPYIWTITSGLLPPGFTLDSNGSITGNLTSA